MPPPFWPFVRLAKIYRGNGVTKSLNRQSGTLLNSINNNHSEFTNNHSSQQPKPHLLESNINTLNYDSNLLFFKKPTDHLGDIGDNDNNKFLNNEFECDMLEGVVDEIKSRSRRNVNIFSFAQTAKGSFLLSSSLFLSQCITNSYHLSRAIKNNLLVKQVDNPISLAHLKDKNSINKYLNENQEEEGQEEEYNKFHYDNLNGNSFKGYNKFFTLGFFGAAFLEEKQPEPLPPQEEQKQNEIIINEEKINNPLDINNNDNNNNNEPNVKVYVNSESYPLYLDKQLKVNNKNNGDQIKNKNNLQVVHNLIVKGNDDLQKNKNVLLYLPCDPLNDHIIISPHSVNLLPQNKINNILSEDQWAQITNYLAWNKNVVSLKIENITIDNLAYFNPRTFQNLKKIIFYNNSLGLSRSPPYRSLKSLKLLGSSLSSPGSSTPSNILLFNPGPLFVDLTKNNNIMKDNSKNVQEIDLMELSPPSLEKFLFFLDLLLLIFSCDDKNCQNEKNYLGFIRNSLTDIHALCLYNLLINTSSQALTHDIQKPLASNDDSLDPLEDCQSQPGQVEGEGIRCSCANINSSNSCNSNSSWIHPKDNINQIKYDHDNGPGNGSYKRKVNVVDLSYNGIGAIAQKQLLQLAHINILRTCLFDYNPK